MRWMIVLIVLSAPAAAFAEEASVRETTAHMRKSPNIAALDIVWLGEDNQVSILETDENWVRVRISIQKGVDLIQIEGWLPEDQLRIESFASDFSDPQLSPDDGDWATDVWSDADFETDSSSDDLDWLTDG